MYISVIWAIVSCGHTASILRAENGGSMFPRNFGTYPEVHTGYYPEDQRRQVNPLPNEFSVEGTYVHGVWGRVIASRN